MHRSLARPFDTKDKYMLPREKAAVFIEGKKLTSEAGQEIRHCLGRRDARDFYTRAKSKGGMGWTASRFDQVAWDSLRDCLEGKPDMYRVWLTKQSSGVCATRSNVSRIQQDLCNKCPNCGLVEKAEHLNRCPSAERIRLLEEGVKTWRSGCSKTIEQTAT